MAELRFDCLAHTYLKNPGAPGGPDWSLKEMSQIWQDGGSFALLGPSGCGKTTLLNILSGLLVPTCGCVFFDDKNVVGLSPQQRNIAQIFQFPVVYDTMSVYDNLAFPLRNRGLAENEITKRVSQVAEALELGSRLQRRASDLTADAKQKISMGRGLVRTDVSAILLDEPLTVIDPELKWRLRSNLKALYRQFRHTMIYVTHDQTEALTFADSILVMHDGRIVQQGSAVELFETPCHKFVGHFIGSPGMNFASCQVENGAALLNGIRVDLACKVALPPSGATVELGVRPEFVKLGREGIPAKVQRMTDIGHHRIADLSIDGIAPRFKALVSAEDNIPTEVKVSFAPERTYVYYDGWMAAAAT